MNWEKSFVIGFAFLSLLLLTSVAYAQNYGYGTSSISLNQSSVSVAKIGGTASVGYTVNLATGNTWGTTLVVNNQNQLNSEGIKVTFTNNGQNPPFSGALNIVTGAGTASGKYQIILSATGDDPTTQNTTLNLTIINNASTSSGGTTVQQNKSNQSKLSSGGSVGSPIIINKEYEYAVIIAILAVATVGLSFRKKSQFYKLIVFGVGIILIGMVVWLYGDYNGGNFTYIWTGISLLLIGTIIWLIGDRKVL